MCGIAGFTNFSKRTRCGDVLEEMLNHIRHRGPDGYGAWHSSDHSVYLGHRRLAIVELSAAGKQPMASHCGRYVIVFNGEIYNYQTLREELLKQRSDLLLRGHSDTEVLVESISLWGLEKTLDKTVGMFAIALWDNEQNHLSLVRDRMGEKPLYYVQGKNGMTYFGSELKSFRGCPGIDFAIDPESVSLMLQYGYVPAPKSIYKDIHKLEAGTVLQISDRGSRSWTYWSVQDKWRQLKSTPFRGDFSEARQHLEDLLEKSISLQMQADVKLGAFLSGGVDSSLVSAVMQSLSGRAIGTYSIGFENQKYDEAPYAREVARHLGTDHSEVYFTNQDLLNVIPTLPQVYDEPFSDSSQLPTILLCRAARKDVAVALSGDAGDELFGGYQRYLTLNSGLQQVMAIPSVIRGGIGQALQMVPPSFIASAFKCLTFMRRDSGEVARLDEKIRKALPLLGADSQEDAYEAILSHWRGNVVSQKLGQASWNGSKGFSLVDATLLEKMTLSDMMAYLPEGILTKVDRASMSTSLETRAPFLDHRVVEFSLSLPDQYKVNAGRGKILLRDILDQYVPKHLIDRPKMGFSVPLGEWLRGPLREWMMDLLSESKIRSQGILDPEIISRRLNEHLSGKMNWEYHLWDVLIFQQWLDSEKK